LKKYKIKSINYLDASKIWEVSPNGCIYNNPSFLKNYKNIKFLSALKGNEVMCCWPIKIDNKKIDIPNFFYYFGPFWSKKIIDQPKHSWLSISNNIYSKFIEYFSKSFIKINFQLHHSLLDIRIFDWWNYHNKNKKRFIITPKYSAVINLLENNNLKKIMSNYRYVRRYEIKNFLENENKIVPCDQNINEMVNLYFKTNLKKNSRVEEKKLKEDLINLFNLANQGFGEIRCFKDIQNDKLVYFNLVLFDKMSVHLVLNSAEISWKKKGIMAWGINSLLNTYVDKFRLFDFNGANSPFRGDDKHSYGAEEKLYFQLNF
jgi:hypothetical protein